MGCSAAGPGPHVPRRRCVKRRSTRCKLQESRGEFPRPAHGGRELRQLQRRGATTPSGPNRDFHVLRRAPGITQGKWPGTRAADFPHSLTWKRKAPLGFPETLDYPHRADPAHSLALTHAGGDRQDATAISARGEGRSSSAGPTEGCGPPRNSSSRRPPPLSSPFPPGPMDEPLALRFLSDPGGREGEKEQGEQPEPLCSQVGALGGGVPFLEEDWGGEG